MSDEPEIVYVKRIKSENELGYNRKTNQIRLLEPLIAEELLRETAKEQSRSARAHPLLFELFERQYLALIMFITAMVLGFAGIYFLVPKSMQVWFLMALLLGFWSSFSFASYRFMDSPREKAFEKVMGKN